ncbi:RNA helicase [Gracilaria domingensis]|nr:RNA helicase [Gracilaria domingensis]
MATAGPWTALRPPLAESVVNALHDTFRHKSMTPVQATAIPPLLTCKDVCVQAETGSGKTLSFLIPIAQEMLKKKTKPSKRIFALVILPTRELASQVHAVACTLFDNIPGDVRPVPLVGGADSSSAGPDAKYKDHRLIIATPGRLAAALESNELHYNTLEMLILDEADRLLDMGFSVTLTSILTRLPRQRRTGIYSATQTEEVISLARAGLRNPVRVVVKVASVEGKRVVPASLSSYYDIVPQGERLARLIDIVAREEGKFIVYFLTCACVEYYRRLPLNLMLSCAKKNINRGDQHEIESQSAERPFIALHGKMNQHRRDRNLARFVESEQGVLFCTDVAARGIDIPDVDWVVQFDAPQEPDAYVHRVGRTARLGRDGRSMIFLAASEESYVDFLKIRKCPTVKFELSESINVLEDVKRVVREATLSDRAILEASELAFLSYIRAYKEHRCRYLFKLDELDINSAADSFGLLRLPRFYEFKKLRSKIKPRGEGVNIREIKFKDKQKEAARQRKISEAQERSTERIEKAARKGKKRKRKAKANDNNERKAKEKGMVRVNQAQYEISDDEEDFSFEAMQLRKLKRGKITEETFDRLTGQDKF